jgi:hypothetical protein
MRIRTGRTAAAAVAVALSWSGAAHAQDTGDLPGPGLEGTPAGRDLDLAQKRPYWSGGKPRPFVSSVVGMGIFYLRPQIAVGYGKPHWRWIGIEEQTDVSIGGGSTYLGLRGALPQGELRVGARYAYPVGQSFLLPQDSYVDDDLDFDDEPGARYLSLEAELTGSLSLFGGNVFGTLGGLYMSQVPDPYYVYEEQLHVVIKPPWLMRARVGYVYGFGITKGLKVGAAAELLYNPGREAVVVRLGPQLGVSLTHHLEAAVSVMVVAASPDSLRLQGNEIGQFGFRYRWATGDLFPEFP